MFRVAEGLDEERLFMAFCTIVEGRADADFGRRTPLGERYGERANVIHLHWNLCATSAS